MKNKNYLIKIFVILFFVANSILGHSQQFGNGEATTLTNYNLNSNPNLASGYYSVNNGTNGAISSSWQHFITYKTPSNNGYALQFNASFFESNRLFFRNVNANTYGAWNEIATRGANTFRGNQRINGKLRFGTSSTHGDITIYNNSDPVSITLQNQTYARFYIESKDNQIQIGSANSKLPGGYRTLNISHNGSIGIGGAPNWAERVRIYGKLAVKGKIEAEDIEVKILNWSDFVFDSNYQLLSLNEVEDFIKKNKHLPSIPSEEQVKNEGVNLGKMDALLLQKIEELTLYIIEQNKRIEQLENANFASEKK